jgi:FtsH-binding integral membrane protein
MMMVFMVAMAYLIYQVKNPQRSESEQIGFMLLISFLMGFVTGPGINMIAEVAPELLIQAALYSSAAFGSFSAVSLFSKRRSYLFLGGIIMTMMQVMCFYSLIGWLFSSGNMFGLGYLMCGLFIACLWIIFDT